MNSLAEPQVSLQPQPAGMKHRFHAMVKPVGSLCNLDGTYCYYLHKDGLLHQPKAPRMSEEMLERHIRQYIEAQTGDEVVFSWQGGEPTLLGLGFFEKVVALEAKYKQPGQRIENDLQTNGTLLDDDWGAFLCKVWDFWYARDFGKVHVDLFETAVAQSMGLPSQRCITAEFCGKGLAIEHTGDVFSCDHYVYPEYRVGNIAATHWSEMAYGETAKKFGFAKRDTLPQYCRQCEHLKLCWGECPKNRLVRTPSGEVGLNYLCPGLKQFYGHIQRDMPEILRLVNCERQ